MEDDRYFIIEIYQALTSEDIEALKFLIECFIKKFPEDNPCEVIDSMWRSNLISSGNFGYLSELLSKIGRKDLEKRIQEKYGRQSGSGASSICPFRVMLFQVSEELITAELQLLRYSYNQFPVRRPLKRGTELFQHMLQATFISPQDVRSLTLLLEKLGRKDLAKKTEAFDQSCCQDIPVMEELSNDQENMEGSMAAPQSEGAEANEQTREGPCGSEDDRTLNGSITDTRCHESLNNISCLGPAQEVRPFQSDFRYNPKIDSLPNRMESNLGASALEMHDPFQSDYRHNPESDSLPNASALEMHDPFQSDYRHNPESDSLPNRMESNLGAHSLPAGDGDYPGSDSLPNDINDMQSSSRGSGQGAYPLEGLASPPPAGDGGSLESIGLPYYRMESNPRGLCVIINNEHFKRYSCHPKFVQLEDRPGSSKDADSLKHSFQRLLFDVKVKTDLSHEEMRQTMSDYAGMDHSGYDCFVCCVLTHGDCGILYGTDGLEVQIKSIWNSMSASNCPSLMGKPKLFFLASCQGITEHRGHSHDLMIDAPSPNCFTAFTPTESDFLVSLATTPGNISYRSRSQGTWYVQELARILDQYAHKEDLGVLLTRLNRDVSLKYLDRNNDGSEITMQMPAPLNLLRHKLRFLQDRNEQVETCRQRLCGICL